MAKEKATPPLWAVQVMTITGVDAKGYCPHGIKATGWDQKWCYPCYLNWQTRQRRRQAKAAKLREGRNER